ncbi:hypothetical protein ACOSQ2_021290 [Xanthoceras sorbifolium]
MTKQGIRDEIWIRLDRALCCMDWKLLFPEGFARHLPRIHFDHYHILLNLHNNHILSRLLKPFGYEKMWMKYAEFDRVVRYYWDLNRESIIDQILILSKKPRFGINIALGVFFKRREEFWLDFKGFIETSILLIGPVWLPLK